MTPRMKDNIPEGWHTYTLGEIYTERKEAGNPELPILTVSIHSGVSDGALGEEEIGKTVKRIADKTQYKTARAGDLVFNMMRAWQGAIGVARSDGLVSPAYIVAIPNEELVYPLFMDYYMKSPKMVGIINRQSYGVTDFRKRLYWDSFASIKCTLPSIAEQKKIVEILAKQDRVVELQQEKIEELVLLKKAYLSKMFPNKGEKVPEIRFSGFTGDWEQRKFEELYKKSSQKNDGTIKIDKNITVASMQYKTDVAVNDEAYLRTYYVFKKGDIAFEGHHSKEFMYGRFVENDIGDGIVSHIFAVFRPIAEYDLFYWKYAINNENVMRSILTRSTKASTMMHDLVSSDFLKETIRVPLIEEQKKIGIFLKSIDDTIALHCRKLEQENQKEKALMQLLLTGIVRA